MEERGCTHYLRQEEVWLIERSWRLPMGQGSNSEGGWYNLKLPYHIGLWGHIEDLEQQSESYRELITVLSKGVIRSYLNFENINLADILKQNSLMDGGLQFMWTGYNAGGAGSWDKGRNWRAGLVWGQRQRPRVTEYQDYSQASVVGHLSR